jgi:RNA polymerase sigma factor FliA
MHVAGHRTPGARKMGSSQSEVSVAGPSLFGGFVSSEAREEAILSSLPLVKSLAQRIQDRLPRHVEIGDLVSAGVYGLIEAANRFDPNQGTSFSTFAFNRIRGAIIDSLRCEDLVSQDLRRKGQRIEETIHRLTVQFGRRPTEKEVADTLNVPLKKYQAMVHQLWMVDIESVDVEIDNGASETSDERDLLINLIPDQSCINQHTYAETRELVDHVRRAMVKLPANQRAVLSSYYYREMSMSQIGSELGVQESCVSKTHAKALLNLKATMMDGKRPVDCRTNRTPRKPITAAQRKPVARVSAAASAFSLLRNLVTA